MKNILKNGFCALLVTASFLSCETVDDVVLPRNTKPTVNLTTTSVSISEDGSADITISTDTALPKDIIFKLIQIGGSAEMDVDYSFSSTSALDYGPIGGRIFIPAGATTGSVTISGVTDFGADANSAVFQLEAIESMRGLVGSTDEVTVTISDFVGEDLFISMSWATSDEDTYHADEQDLDFYITDANGNYVGSYAAATGEMPEVNTVSGAWPDGTYYIDVDYWAPSDISYPGEPALFTVEHILTIDKAGAFSTVIKNNYTDEDATTSEYLQWSGYSAYGGDGYREHVAQIEKVGTTYTVKDMNGTTVASGKFGSIKKSPRQKFGKALILN